MYIAPKKTHPIIINKRYFPLPNLVGVHVSGRMNYHIIVGGKSNSMVASGDAKVLSALHYKVQNGVLFVYYKFRQGSKQNEDFFQPLQVELHLTKLIRLEQVGHSNVIVNGVIALSTIDFSGPGFLQLYWVKSNRLVIRTAGSGTLALAGIACTVNASVHDKSHLNIRFLRVGTLFVKTYDEGIADVWPQNNLYAIAYDNSNIYYYHEPDYKSRMMKQAGSVLRMWDIPGAIVTFNPRF